MRFSINPNLKFAVRHVGDANTPIIEVEDFITDSQPLFEQAICGDAFRPISDSYYPGVRTELNRDIVIAVLQAVYHQIGDTYAIPPALKLKPQTAYFSLIDQAPDDLILLQRLPHFDATQPYYFAVLLYLSPGEHGNTGLFRHNPTGLERITTPQVEHYLDSATQHVKQHGEPPQQYFTQSDDHYTLYDEITYQPKKLVIYPGNLLHSTLVDVEKDISADPNKGRLTANIFIDFR